MDHGETFDETLKREVREETGLEIRLLRPVDTAMSSLSNCHVVYLFMLAETEPGEVRLSTEHDRYHWADAREMESVDLTAQFRAVARQCTSFMAP
jgi:8-oxo-dGTP pyrophosphatase MutT (NUDIX family)